MTFESWLDGQKALSAYYNNGQVIYDLYNGRHGWRLCKAQVVSGSSKWLRRIVVKREMRNGTPYYREMDVKCLNQVLNGKHRRLTLTPPQTY